MYIHSELAFCLFSPIIEKDFFCNFFPHIPFYYGQLSRSVESIDLTVLRIITNSHSIPQWKCKSLSHVWLFATQWTIQSMEFSRPAGVDSLSLLQGIFPTQELNPGLLHCGQIFTSWATREAQEYWRGVAYPFSSGSSRPRNLTGISCIAGGFFTTVHPVCSVMSIFVDFLSLFSFVDLAYISNSAINTFVCLYLRSEIIRLKRIWICTLKILLDYFPKKVVVRKLFSQTWASQSGQHIEVSWRAFKFQVHP